MLDGSYVDYPAVPGEKGGLLSKVVGFALYTCIYLYLGCIRHNTRICLYLRVSLGIGSTKV